MPVSKPTHTLPIGYILHDIYEIESVIGEGGFGITYRAILYNNGPISTNTEHSAHNTPSDTDTSHYIAIKEYYPSGIATRTNNTDNPYSVTHFNGKMEIAFNKGLERFGQEAYLLKEFEKLESIVTVLDIFNENDTTYIVMEYIEGLTIQKIIENEGPLPFDELMELMTPLLDDLHTIHSKGLIHRDISPDNLLIGTDNRLHLIDFGSANHSNLNASKTFTVILKAGYAPPEQYSPKGKLGPWTDVYGCSAVMYYALTGNAPLDSLQRMQRDEHNTELERKLADIPDLSTYAQNAILTGLALSYKERYPSIRMFHHALTTSPGIDDIHTEIKVDVNEETKSSHENSTLINAKSFSPKKSLIYNVQHNKYPVLISGILVIALIIGILYFKNGVFSDSSINTLKQTSHLPDITDTQDTSDQRDDTDNLANEMNNDENNISNDNTADSIKENTVNTSSTSRYYPATENNSEILTMVNMIGKTLEQAEAALNELDSGISVQTSEEYSKTYSKGTVIAQSIQSNTQFTKGNISTITLTISKGERPSTEASDSTSGNNSSGSQKADSSSNSGNNPYKVTGSDQNDGYTTIHIGD